jgi:hypothetical protein
MISAMILIINPPMAAAFLSALTLLRYWIGSSIAPLGDQSRQDTGHGRLMFHR